MPLIGIAIDRRGQVIDDGVEQRLHALVLEGRAAEHRDEGDVAHRLADQALEGRLVRLGAVEIGRHGVVVEFDRRLDQREAIFLGALHEVGRDLLVMVVGAERLVVPDDRLHADEVDDALEVGLGADRQLDADRRGRRRGS